MKFVILLTIILTIKSSEAITNAHWYDGEYLVEKYFVRVATNFPRWRGTICEIHTQV